MTVSLYFIYFFFKYTATTVIYTLSLHDALPIFLAFWGTKLLILWGPQQIPRISDVQVNSWVLIFTLFVSLATGILTGLAPALQAAQVDQREALQQTSRSLVGVSRCGFRSLLVVAQVACAFVLAAGSALLLK